MSNKFVCSEFDRGGRSTQWRKDSIYNKRCWESWTGTGKKANETRPPAYTVHQNKFKTDKNSTISRDTIKVLEENPGRKISDIPHRNIFANLSPRAREIK